MHAPLSPPPVMAPLSPPARPHPLQLLRQHQEQRPHRRVHRDRRRDGLPTLQLTADQVVQLRTIEKRLLEQYLERYEEYAEQGNRSVDALEWKLSRQSNGVKVYKRRSASRRNPHLHLYRDHGDDATERAEPMLLVVGSIDGTLEDVLYGAVWSSRDERATRSHFTKDGIVDAAVLCALEKASAMNPFRSLAVKWSLKRSMRSAALIKDRDFVYLGATGTLRTSSDERLGFELRHSLKIPAFPPMPGSSVVRAEIMSCSFFRQMRGGRVEVFHQASFDAGGDLLSILAWNHAVDHYVGFESIVECSFTKKLVRAVQWSSDNPPPKLDDTDPERPWEADSERRCGTCGQPSGSIERKCALCYQWVCSHCSVKRDIFTPLPGRPSVARCFCKTCIGKVVRDDPTQYVLRELEQFEQRTATEYAPSPDLSHQRKQPSSRSDSGSVYYGEEEEEKQEERYSRQRESSESVFFALDASPPQPGGRRRLGSMPVAAAPPPPPPPLSSQPSRRMSVPANARIPETNNENAPPNVYQRHNGNGVAPPPPPPPPPPPLPTVPMSGRRHSTAVSTRATYASRKNPDGEILLRSDSAEKKWRHRELEQQMDLERLKQAFPTPGSREGRRRMTVLGTEGTPPPPPPPPEPSVNGTRRGSIASSDRRRSLTNLTTDIPPTPPPPPPPEPSNRSSISGSHAPPPPPPAPIPRRATVTVAPSTRAPAPATRPPLQPRPTDIYAPWYNGTHQQEGQLHRRHPTSQPQASAFLGPEPLRQHVLLPKPQPQALTTRRDQRQPPPFPSRSRPRAPPPPPPQRAHPGVEIYYPPQDVEKDPQPQHDGFDNQHESEDEFKRRQRAREQDAMAVNALLAELGEIARLTDGALAHTGSSSMDATIASTDAAVRRVQY